jgi:hypothetical protein
MVDGPHLNYFSGKLGGVCHNMYFPDFFPDFLSQFFRSFSQSKNPFPKTSKTINYARRILRAFGSLSTPAFRARQPQLF